MGRLCSLYIQEIKYMIFDIIESVFSFFNKKKNEILISRYYKKIRTKYRKFKRFITPILKRIRRYSKKYWKIFIGFFVKIYRKIRRFFLSFSVFRGRGQNSFWAFFRRFFLFHFHLSGLVNVLMFLNFGFLFFNHSIPLPDILLPCAPGLAPPKSEGNLEKLPPKVS